MKKLILTFLILLPLVLYSQAHLSEDEFKRYETHNISNEFNLFTGSAGIFMTMYSLTANGDISIDDKFTRAEAYLYSGALLTTWSVVNNRWKIIELYSSKNRMLRLGLILLSISTDAIGDARFDLGYKKNGKMYQAISLASALSIPMFTNTKKEDWYWFGLSYMALRFNSFDYTYNSTYGLPLDYRGSTTHYDNSLKGVGDKAFHVVKGLSGYIGLVMYFKID
jgi:hypothetical protein